VDVFLAKDGTDPNPHHPEYDPQNIHHIRKRERCFKSLLLVFHDVVVLTPYMARPKVRKQKNLLSASQEGEQMEPEEVNFISLSLVEAIDDSLYSLQTSSCLIGTR
jgi:hypothetical protein